MQCKLNMDFCDSEWRYFKCHIFVPYYTSQSSKQGEEVAGAPLMCQAEGEWHLVGVAAWRKGCSSIGQRPRLYDKVSPNSEWAQKTIRQLDQEDKNRKQKKDNQKRGRTPKKADKNIENESR